MTTVIMGPLQYVLHISQNKVFLNKTWVNNQRHTRGVIKKKFKYEEYVNKICISFVTLCVNMSTQIKQSLLFKEYPLQIKFAVVDWVCQ